MSDLKIGSLFSGPSGRPALSARFVEWMMCLPDGWVTDTPGVSRNEALRMGGNGVVIPQMEAALEDMLRYAPRNLCP